MPHIKDFIGWHNRKAKIDQQNNLPTFKEREIWWCSIGINVGHEEDGKNEDFHRPVLILRKFNKNLFWGVPLTTQIKENPFYIRIKFREIEQCAMITHLRSYDAKRLTDEEGRLSNKQFQKVKQAVKDLL